MSNSGFVSLSDPGQIPTMVEARGDVDLRRLLGYVELETPTGDRAGLDGFADRLATDLAPARMTARRVPTAGGDVLVGFVAGRGPLADAPPAVVLAHHDTVHPVGSLRGAVPLRRDGSTLYGPGAYDMKGGLVVAIAALELLRRLPHRPVSLVVTPDEEIGSPASAPTVLAVATGAAYVLGLEPPHPDGALKTARMGSTRWRVDVTGRAAHAALDPDAGVNAIDELVDQVYATRQILARYPQVLLNVGTLSGGGRTNVVPDAAHADLGLRFSDAATERAVITELGGLRAFRTGAEVTSTALTHRPVWEPGTPASELLAQVRAAGAVVDQVVDGRPAAGAADTNLTGAAGVPSLDGFGPLGGGAHSAQERIDLRSLPQRIALLTAVLATV